MKLPSEILSLRDRYVKTFPMWSMPPGTTAENRARAWTLGLISQIEYEFPGKFYGSKKADPTRPLSKDSISQQQPNGTLFGWDMMTGAGTGSPQIVSNPSSTDITGQYYVAVEGRDVISGAAPPDTGDGGGSGGGDGSRDLIPYNEGYAVQFGEGCNDVYKEANTASVDPGMISVHSQRAAWDYYVGGMTWDASYKKHINEFRKEYGLPPV